MFLHILFALNLQNLSFLREKVVVFFKVFQDGAFEGSPEK